MEWLARTVAEQIASEFTSSILEIIDLRQTQDYQWAEAMEHSTLSKLSSFLIFNKDIPIPDGGKNIPPKTGHPRYLAEAIDIYEALFRSVNRTLKRPIPNEPSLPELDRFKVPHPNKAAYETILKAISTEISFSC